MGSTPLPPDKDSAGELVDELIAELPNGGTSLRECVSMEPNTRCQSWPYSRRYDCESSELNGLKFLFKPLPVLLLLFFPRAELGMSPFLRASAHQNDRVVGISLSSRWLANVHPATPN